MNEINSNRVEIVDKLTPKDCTAAYSGCCVSISLLITIFTLLQAEPPNKYLIIPMFAIVVIIGILIFHYEKKLRTKICKFYISDESIEIFIPPGPWFKISWVDIKGVSVTRITKHLMFMRHYVLVSLPEISFSIKDQLDRTIQLRKFHSSKKKEILKLLKYYSYKQKKSFFGPDTMKDI